MAHWIKILEDRKQYIVNLDRIGAFCAEANQRIKFWLPDSGQPLVVSGLANPEVYQILWNYIEKIIAPVSQNYWIRLEYERKEYLINLSRIQAFACDAGKRITFWLPDGVEPIILNPQTYPEVYHQVQEYIRNTTGYSLP
ncbi:hypothetical protein [Lyngbya sp. PCC 8106]|uniref:hypothetical protein n=1 Tax=Lyngbya sp. (strain PCC 8106) TaxID=313612 RepID=UPI0000EACEEE|nr:hypothetical protein [Lyngbya sp. PCC 8106]EAW33852.1 hypothetical protein L8106_29310 [Lyngbya sp. PCC 8106]